MDCRGLTDPLNGQVALNSTTFQSVAAYECDSGFNLEGDMERTCQASGEWSGAAPTCNRMFPKTLITVIKFLIRFPLSHSLFLSPPLSLSLAVDCGGLTDPLNGQVALNSTTFQSVAAYECDSGFNLEGDTEQTCQASGEWSGTAPTCNCMFQKTLITMCSSS